MHWRTPKIVCLVLLGWSILYIPDLYLHTHCIPVTCWISDSHISGWIGTWASYSFEDHLFSVESTIVRELLIKLKVSWPSSRGNVYMQDTLHMILQCLEKLSGLALSWTYMMNQSIEMICSKSQLSLIPSGWF